MVWTNSLLHFLVDAEPILDLIALVAILRAGLLKRYPAMTFYLGFRCATEAGLFFILNEHHFFAVSVRTQTLTYFYGYWICYALGAVAIFFVIQEIFKSLMQPIPDLQRLGLIAFRWVSIATVIVLVSTAAFPHARTNSNTLCIAIGTQLMRFVSILEICLLAYLALTIHSLGRSYRSRLFGLGLGLGLQAAGDLIVSALLTRFQSIWSWENLVLETMSIATLVVWTVYLALPEPAEERSPVTLPITSPLLRWNAIASALGQRPAHVALGATSSAFFLQDVEDVVDKFLTKTP